MQCNLCEKKFLVKGELNRHLKNRHNTLPTPLKSTNKCAYDTCTFTFDRVQNYYKHLEAEHSFVNCPESYIFSTKEEYTAWIEGVQRDTCTNYSIRTTSTIRDGRRRSYMQCNRTGCFATRSQGKRQLKSQGSCKVGSNCPSEIVVTTYPSKESLYCSVQYQPKHLGHDFLLGHVKTPKSVRCQIAGQLVQGVEDQRVLADLRSTINHDLRKEHILTTKDLRNIRTSFGIAPADSAGRQIHVDDSVSVAAWVESERKLGKQNSVLYYKPQEEGDSEFVLVIMTPFQKEMYKKYGGSGVCMDSTHGTTSYDFELTSLMVIDQFEEGFPAAFCISNTVNTKILTDFLSAVKNAVGVIEPTHFMSDDAPMMLNAWVSVMGGTPQKLICAWHVDRAWQDHLKAIKDVSKRDLVYRTLRGCLYELEKAKFDEMLDEFLEECSQDEDEDVKKFGGYFMATYYNRKEVWAYCFRIGAKINTNMHIDNFHLQLKHVYMKGKKCKRLDKLVLSLKDFLNDKLFDRIRALHKGKVPRKIQLLLQNHSAGEILAPHCNILTPEKWSCPSQSTLGKVYTVEKIEHECTNITCIVKCYLCLACLNGFKCECQENSIRWNLCKHIHAISLFNMGDSLCEPNYHHQAAAEIVEEVVVRTSLLKPCEENSANARERIRERLQRCIERLPTCSLSVLKDANGHIECLEKLLSLDDGFSENAACEENLAKNDPKSKKADKQSRSTKKKIKIV